MFVTKLPLRRAAVEMHWGRQLAGEWEKYEDKLEVGGAGMKVIWHLQKGVRILCTSEYHITK